MMSRIIKIFEGVITSTDMGTVIKEILKYK